MHGLMEPGGNEGAPCGSFHSVSDCTQINLPGKQETQTSEYASDDGACEQVAGIMNAKI